MESKNLELKKAIFLIINLALLEFILPLLSTHTSFMLGYYSTAGNPIGAAISAGGATITGGIFEIALAVSASKLAEATTAAAICAAIPGWGWLAFGMFIGFS